ncbi:MAG: flagellar motor protein [Chloroflexota bacterium]
MDIGTIGGLVIAIGALYISLMMEGGEVGGFVNTPALLIVMGGTFGATLVAFPLPQVLGLPKLIAGAFVNSKNDCSGVINLLVELADKARRNGLLALEDEGERLSDGFLKKGVQLLVDGTDPEALRNILDIEMSVMEHRNEAGYGILETMGGFAPTMGIIGTVMGLVNVLASLDEPSSLGPAIAVAFIATFYGVATANIVWLPLASKLKKKSQQDSLLRHAMLEGLLSIQAGDNPRIVREKLEGFLDPNVRNKESNKKEEGMLSGPAES